MVSIDDTLRIAPPAAAAGTRWRRPPRWLVLPVVLPVALPLFLVLGLAVGTLVNLGLSAGGMDRHGTGLAGSAVAAERAGLASPAVCRRMHQIVTTACSLRQRDHLASGIHHCIAEELKYTMWTPYGCG